MWELGRGNWDEGTGRGDVGLGDAERGDSDPGTRTRGLGPGDSGTWGRVETRGSDKINLIF